jgi:hypothetical protein
MLMFRVPGGRFPRDFPTKILLLRHELLFLYWDPTDRSVLRCVLFWTIRTDIFGLRLIDVPEFVCLALCFIELEGSLPCSQLSAVVPSPEEN